MRLGAIADVSATTTGWIRWRVTTGLPGHRRGPTNPCAGVDGYTPFADFSTAVVSADYRSRWEIKATAPVASGRRAWLTGHIGDVENPRETLRDAGTFGGVLADLGTCHARGGGQ